MGQGAALNQQLDDPLHVEPLKHSAALRLMQLLFGQALAEKGFERSPGLAGTGQGSVERCLAMHGAQPTHQVVQGSATVAAPCVLSAEGKFTPAKQIADIETMMVKGIDGLVILATESAPITPVAKEAHERGIYIVNVDRGFLEPVADVFLEGDNKSFGRKSAQYIVDKLGGKGKVVILEGIPSTVNSDRVNSAMEVFKANPGIEIVGQASGMWNRQKSMEVMQTLLLKAPKIDAVWASDDDMALGVEQAISEAGRKEEMWILGGAGMKDVVKRVMDGDRLFPANITYPPSMIAMGMQIAVSSLMIGKEKASQFTPRHLMIDVELIEPANAKNYYFPDSIY